MRQTHDQVLRELLGVVSTGPAAEDNAVGADLQLEAMNAAAQVSLNEGFKLVGGSASRGRGHVNLIHVKLLEIVMSEEGESCADHHP